MRRQVREAGQRSAQGRLAGAVAAEHRGHLLRRGLEADTLQHVALAVERVHVGDGQHLIPRYDACTAALAATCSRVPCVSTAPWVSTVIVSASANATSISCSISR